MALFRGIREYIARSRDANNIARVEDEAIQYCINISSRNTKSHISIDRGTRKCFRENLDIYLPLYMKGIEFINKLAWLTYLLHYET